MLKQSSLGENAHWAFSVAAELRHHPLAPPEATGLPLAIVPSKPHIAVVSLGVAFAPLAGREKGWDYYLLETWLRAVAMWEFLMEPSRRMR